MKKYAYVNGKVVDINKPAVALDDLGFLRAYGVFDFLKVYNGKPFHFDDHFQHLVNSARVLDIKMPYSKESVLNAVKGLIKKNKVDNGSVRLVLTGGRSDNGIAVSEKPTFCVLVEDIYEEPEKVFRDGGKLIKKDYSRTLPSSKNLSYTTAVKWQKDKKKAGATEILYVHDGKIFEGATSNFFIFKGDTLITAKDDIYSGITRKIVIKLAKKYFKVEERELLESELVEATEAFITGSNKKVLPIVKIDNLEVGDGKVGKNTKKLMIAYQEYVDKY